MLLSRNRLEFSSVFKEMLSRFRHQRGVSEVMAGLEVPKEGPPRLLDSSSLFPPASTRYPSNEWRFNAARAGYSSASSMDSAFSGVSSTFSTGSRKRQRQSRCEGQFVCTHGTCFEVFDRQCDLTHHERSHLPYEKRPYLCDQCEKRFLYPKDLRRHEQTHRATENDSGAGLVSEALMST